MDIFKAMVAPGNLQATSLTLATGIAVGSIGMMALMNKTNHQKSANVQNAGLVRQLSHRLDKKLMEAMKAAQPTDVFVKRDSRGGKLYCTKIALTGGPCAGKSSSMESLRSMLTGQGYDVYFAPEVPTIMMNGGCKYPGIEGKETLMQFEEGLINLQLQVENTFTQVATSTGRPSVLICDRGLMDIKAYLPEDLWNELLQRLNLTESYLLGRYDLVLHLVTAAHGAEKFYTLEQAEGVSVRTETAEQARGLDDKMRSCWSRHPNHAVIGNDGKSFQDKLDKVNEHVMATVKALTHADLAAQLLAQQLRSESAEATFRAFDSDGSGYIDASELKDAVQTFGMSVTLLEAEMLIKDLSKMSTETGSKKVERLDFEHFRQAVLMLSKSKKQTA